MQDSPCGVVLQFSETANKDVTLTKIQWQKRISNWRKMEAWDADTLVGLGIHTNFCEAEIVICNLIWILENILEIS